VPGENQIRIVDMLLGHWLGGRNFAPIFPEEQSGAILGSAFQGKTKKEYDAEEGNESAHRASP
jgi:hypothetical protein